MKKYTLIFLLIFLTTPHVTHAQVEQKFNLAVAKGDVIVDAYYGFVTFHRTGLQFVALQYTGSNESFTYSGYGPVGGRVEYMVSNMIGLGMEFNYAHDVINWQENNNYNYQYSVTRMRLFPRLNIHFSDDDKIDAFVGIGAGYREVTRVMTSENPNFNSYRSPAFIPIAVRVSVGMRYFFSDHVGLGIEAGFGGGAILHPGLAIKF